MFGVQILEKCLLISKITPFVGKLLNLVKWLTRSKDSMGGSKVKVKLLNNIRRCLKVTFGTVTAIASIDDKVKELCFNIRLSFRND